jgi:mono/diheme cytochrome c family protein
MAQIEGEQLFSTICVACHTIGNGRLVGPDLKDVDKKVSGKWMKAFIRSSQTVIKGGDKTANDLFTEYGSIVMPDQLTFTDEQIGSIIAYIKSKGTPDIAAKKDTASTKSKIDTSTKAMANATVPTVPTSNATVATAKTVAIDTPAGIDPPSLFSNSMFWIIGGFLVLLMFVIYTLSKTVLALMRIVPKGSSNN